MRATLPDNFDAEVYALVRLIPKGKVLTYGQIARLLGLPDYARRVGRALSLAPAKAGIPCHRVVNGSGRTVPGWPGQRKQLENEGILFKANGCVDLIHCTWEILHSEE